MYFFVFFVPLWRNSSSPEARNPKPVTSDGAIMKKYVCDACGWVYDPAKGDPENGVAAGTAFEDLPDSWVCPECGLGKEQFSPAE